MTAGNKQIFVLRDRGCSSKEIASLLDYDESLVASVLAESEVSRGRDVKEVFSDNDLSVATETLVAIAQCSENDSARVKAAMFIIEVKGGIKAPPVSNTSVFNIGELNLQMGKARSLASKMLTVDV